MLRKLASLTSFLFVLTPFAPAGAAVIYDDGQMQGTALDVSSPSIGWAAIVVDDRDLTDNRTRLELDKTFHTYAEDCPEDLPPTGLPLLIEFRLPSAAAVGSGTFDIVISDEHVRNNTCTPWWDYEMILVGPEGSVSFFGTPNPVSYFTDVEMGPDRLHFVDGVWPNDGLFHVLHQSLVGQELGIRVNLLPSEELVFTLKERPSVPEPAAMGLLAVGGGLLALRRRRA